MKPHLVKAGCIDEDFEEVFPASYTNPYDDRNKQVDEDNDMIDSGEDSGEEDYKMSDYGDDYGLDEEEEDDDDDDDDDDEDDESHEDKQMEETHYMDQDMEDSEDIVVQK